MNRKDRFKRFWAPGGSFTDEDLFFLAGMAAALIGGAAAFLYLVFPEIFRKVSWMCPIHLLTGLYCPGCGGTRAFLALIKGQVLESIIDHPAVIYMAAPGAVFVVSQLLWRIRGRGWRLGYSSWYLYILFAIFMLNCIVKNALLLIWNIRILT